MLFNSVPFVVLVAVTFAIYYAPFLRARSWQVLVLIFASFVFYGYGQPKLLLLLVASIAINVLTSYWIAVDRPSRRRLWAVTGITLNLALLVFFKYAGLLANLLPGLTATSVGHVLTTIPLPIGISFFTFQGISLVAEAFRGHRPASGGSRNSEPRIVCRNFMEHLRNTAFFKSFFPYLVAGPIVKAHEFYPQIGTKKFKDIQWETAFRCLVVGYFLKMVVADNLKDATFWISYPAFLRHSSIGLTGLLFGFSMQIFADFAGYSLIAIGLARLFGYILPINFNFPYLSRSFTDFWKRWHISLSTWLRDYLYFPLGGNRKGTLRTYFNLFVVMFLGGLWHGASWKYAVWGTFHGLALAVERSLRNKIHLPRNWSVDSLRVLMVFSFVTLAWLLFKLPTLQQALQYVGAIFHSIGQTRYVILACILTYSTPVLLYYLWHVLNRRWRPHLRRYEDWILAALLVAIALNSGSPQKFIYFQF
ncbi:MAG: MBOAT family O-acyltransferase [Chthoniobacterales bacterium]